MVWIKENGSELKQGTPDLLYNTDMVAEKTGVLRRSGSCWIVKENRYF